jgi:DNA topoisomerase IB
MANGLEAARKLKSRLAARNMQRLGLRYVGTDELPIRRKRVGESFTFVSARGRTIRDELTRARLKRLAVPPAYEEVLYAADPRAHIQAIGRDAAGRLQYRYHADWEKVRERRKAKRLQRLVEAMPRIRRAVNKHLGVAEPTREFALAAVIELIACSAIRAGSESYLKEHGTRGATTLLKSHVEVHGTRIVLKFRAKGGKRIEKDFHCPRAAMAINVLRALPGTRLFQYAAENGETRFVTARGERVPARDRGREDIAEGFPHAQRVRRRARGAGACRARVERERTAAAGQGSRDRGVGGTGEYAGDLPQELRASDRGGGFREREAGKIFRDAEGQALARTPRAASGAGRGDDGGVITLPLEGRVDANVVSGGVGVEVCRDDNAPMKDPHPQPLPAKGRGEHRVCSYPFTPPILHTSFHSSSLTACTERRASRTSTMLLSFGSALIAASVTGLDTGATALVSTA